jgi:probable HAF family extracellular repeat protein
MKFLKRANPKTGAEVWMLLLITLGANVSLGQSTITNVPTLGGSGSSATALNSSGQVVGFSMTSGDLAQHAFLYGNGIVYDLGGLGGTFSLATGINAGSQVIGEGTTVNDLAYHAFLFSGGQISDLGTLGGSMSSAIAINNLGQVAGFSLVQGDGEQHAFLFANGMMLDLGTLGGTFSSPVGVNSSGQVAGNSFTANDASQHAFLGTTNSLMDLGILGGSYSSATALNDAGQVVGESDTTNSETHAFLAANGTMLDLGTLGGNYSTAYSINNAGQVIGDSSTDMNAEYHAFVYQNGKMLDLGTLGGNYSTATSINDLGQVVGNSADTNNVSVPFLWQNGVMADLNSFLPDNSGWVLAAAFKINDRSQVLGYGFYNGNFSWYLFSIIPPNRPPVAVAGPDQTVECPALVVLDGSKSSDPDQDVLAFEWREGSAVLGSGALLSVRLPLGSHNISLVVTDPGNLSSQSSVVVNIVDTTPPTVFCPATKPAGANANCLAPVPDLVSSAVATDNCADSTSLVRTQIPAPGTLVGPGSYSITVRVTDPSGNSSACSSPFVVADLIPPILVCPSLVTTSADANGVAAVPDFTTSLNASDNCSSAAELLKGQTPAAGTLLGPGSYLVKLTATDAAGNASTCSANFSVQDTTPPSVVCPAGVTLSADNNCQALVPDFSALVNASDNCTPAGQLTRSQVPPAGTSAGLGVHSITVTVSDAAGNTASCSASLTVTDTTAPVINSVTATPTVLSQANHQMVAVAISVSAADTCDANPVSQILSISSDEPVTGPGDNTSPDWEITGPLTANLRAEHSPQGNGRTYTITVRCTDAAGNSSTKSTLVTVPKTSSPKKAAPLP